jgi:organic hydroperoxide reductase OsmC/OhrA
MAHSPAPSRLRVQRPQRAKTVNELMSEHHATVRWRRDGAEFREANYSRAHAWEFDGGARVPAAAAPALVAAPWTDPAGVDPQEAYVVALASSHMLWFLYVAAAHGFIVDSYEDAAVGHLAGSAPKQPVVADVTLRPRIVFDRVRPPSVEQVAALHREAHERCFLANSVKTAIRVEPAR